MEPAIDGRTQQLRRPVSTLEKHKSYVSHVSFQALPSRTFCAIGPRILFLHIDIFYCNIAGCQVAFSHFGEMLVSSGGDFKVIIWNLKDFTIFGIYDEALAPVSHLRVL